MLVMADVKQKTQDGRDNIWITSKCRMITEAKYRRYAIISHLILVEYPVSLIIITIFSNFYDASFPVDNFSIAISVVILSGSLIIYGFRFEEIANTHRDCYLRLQKIYNTEGDDLEISNKYHDILKDFPNHSQSDYNDFIIERTLFKKDAITINGHEKKWTISLLIAWFFRKIAFASSVLMLLGAPILLITWPTF